MIRFKQNKTSTPKHKTNGTTTEVSHWNDWCVVNGPLRFVCLLLTGASRLESTDMPLSPFYGTSTQHLKDVMMFKMRLIYNHPSKQLRLIGMFGWFDFNHIS